MEQPDYEALACPELIIPDGKYPVFQLLSTKAQIFLIMDLLTSAECDYLVNISSDMWRPSGITRPTPDKDFRTSKTADIGMVKDPIVQVVDQRICDVLGIPLEYSEATQIQLYEVGQQFKHHTDFFKDVGSEYQQYVGARGNRTWTFMVYLNDVEEGGGTDFKSVNCTIKPRKGMGLAWNNRHADGETNTNTEHAGLPIIKGTKVVITKWFRENK
jgi:prolyl 4-hydroxylase